MFITRISRAGSALRPCLVTSREVIGLASGSAVQHIKLAQASGVCPAAPALATVPRALTTITSTSTAGSGSRLKTMLAHTSPARNIHTRSIRRSSGNPEAGSKDSVVEAAADSAAAEAADAATAAYPHISRLFSVGSSSGFPKGSCVITVRGEPAVYMRLLKAADLPEGIPMQVFRHKFSTYLQAACAADLGRLALAGGLGAAGDVKLNFPPELYTPKQVAAMAALMLAKVQKKKLQLQLPRLAGVAAAADDDDDDGNASSVAVDVSKQQAAAAAAGRSSPRTEVHMVETAAREVIAAAAAELRLRLANPPNRFRGVSYEATAGSVNRSKRAKPWRMKAKTSRTRVMGWYATAEEAAVAYDLTIINLRGPEAASKEDHLGSIINFPVQAYTKEQIDAVLQLLKVKYGIDPSRWA